MWIEVHRPDGEAILINASDFHLIDSGDGKVYFHRWTEDGNQDLIEAKESYEDIRTMLVGKRPDKTGEKLRRREEFFRGK